MFLIALHILLNNCLNILVKTSFDLSVEISDCVRRESQEASNNLYIYSLVIALSNSPSEASFVIRGNSFVGDMFPETGIKRSSRTERHLSAKKEVP